MCNVALFTAVKESFALDGCRRCGGAWFGAEEARHVLALGELAEVARIIDDTSDAKRVGDGLRTCRDCSAILTPRTLRAPTGGRGFVVDVCAAHGAWFDRGELQKAVEAIRDAHDDLRGSTLLEVLGVAFPGSGAGPFR